MAVNSTVKGRFAPSPSGVMHAGNIFSSLVAWLFAKCQGGSMVLRIENLDPQRSKKAYIDKIQSDYEKLGLTWDEGPYFQDEPLYYEEAFHQLELLELTYPCFCSRADVHAASAPHRGERHIYAGTCRMLSDDMRRQKARTSSHSWRVKTADRQISFNDAVQGLQSFNVQHECGDFIIRRSDGVYAYQLAVVVDDSRMGVTSVVRGNDLLDSTPQQIYLYEMLKLPQPEYAHVPLFVDATGRRLSKRHKDAEIDSLMQTYGSADGVIGAIAHRSGLVDEACPVSPEQLLNTITFDKLIGALSKRGNIVWP